LHDSSKENSKDVADDNSNTDPSQHSSNEEIENSLRENRNSLTSSSNLVREGIIAGKRIAKISVITLLAIGIVEIVTGYLSGSVVATADGIDSISDAMISFIVLLGLNSS
jgi:Co/Zn/Cd efflux system component